MARRKYYGSEQWKTWILECMASGQKIKDWCLSNGVSESQFFRWKKRLVDRGELEWHKHQLVPTDKNAGKPMVVQMNFSDLEGTPPYKTDRFQAHASLAESILASQVVIEAPSSGCRIYVGTGFSQDTLKKVMEVIR